MKFKSALVTQISGSIGGMTGSHNRGGLYFRARATPVNPNTLQQQTVRSRFGELANLWVNTLTTPQREAWDLYALNVLLPDSLGEPRNVGGLGMYIRSNVPRITTGLPRVDTAPAIFDLGNFGPPSVSALSAAGQNVSVAFPGIEDWPGEDDAAMLMYVSRPANVSINFFKGPYRVSASILGDSAAPPATPQVLSVTFPFLAGQKVFFRFNVTRADGRYGQDVRTFAIAGA